MFVVLLCNLCVLMSVQCCQFGAEFRRFSLDRSKPGRFDEFYGLLQHVHRIPNVDLLVGYADVHGDLLPINNDDNYHKAMSVAAPLLRLFLQRKGEGCFFKWVIGQTSTLTVVVHLSICMMKLYNFLQIPYGHNTHS